jgi:hypothetical protein
MSKQLLIEYSTFKPLSNLKEGLSRGGNLMVIGKLSSADVPNANRRIYPFDILRSQVQKYIDGPICEKRAFGELDHPECLRPSAMILTNSGWKYIKDVTVGENVLTLNTETNQNEWNPIERVINKPYKGKAFSLKGKSIDTVVTPNHRFILRDRYDKYEEATIQDIYDEKKSYSHHQIPKSIGKWTGVNFDFITIPTFEYSKNSRVPKIYREKYSKPLVIKAIDWFSFLGFYLAEGGISKTGVVTISQNKGHKLDKFMDLIGKMSNDIDWAVYSKTEKCSVVQTNDKRLSQYLSKFGNIYTKHIPDNYKNASSDLLLAMYDWFKLGDGSDVTTSNNTRSSIFSVSYKLIEDFNEILIKTGKFGDIKEQISKKDYEYAGHTIEIKNKKTLYRLWSKKTKGICLDKRFLKIEEIDYDDTVHCVTVKNGNFYCKDQGLSFLSGNCSTINLKNVSHNIVECWWDGKDLYGKVEILPTPSGNILKTLFENGLTIGISSRAMGSVSQIGEGLVQVEDDLDIICWDFVSTPSNFGSYMKPELKPGLRESIEYSDKYSRTSKLISEIICLQSGVCCLK